MRLGHSSGFRDVPAGRPIGGRLGKPDGWFATSGHTQDALGHGRPRIPQSSRGKGIMDTKREEDWGKENLPPFAE